MAEDSKIEWTTHTFNPWRGCSKVSDGCARCYAETMSGRNPKTLGAWGPNGTRVVAAEAQWKLPVKWDRAAKAAGERHRVFCASLADVFEDWQGPMVAANGDQCFQCDNCVEPDGRFYWDAAKPLDNNRYYEHACGERLRPLTMSDVRARLFQLIDATPNLDWLLLTKRPENVAKMIDACNLGLGEHFDLAGRFPNLWIGTSVENQAAAEERIPHLLQISAAVRFLSVEPLLGPIRLSGLLNLRHFERDYRKLVEQCGGEDRMPAHLVWNRKQPGKIDWVIVGGESGPGARPCRVEWIRDLVRQWKTAGVPVFVKQLGSNPAGDDFPEERNPVTGNRILTVRQTLTIRDRKGGDMEEWPADLRVREFPTLQRIA